LESVGKSSGVKLDNLNCKVKQNLLVVSHDSGGAEVLSSYLRHKRKEYGVLRCVVKGPAERIFHNKGLRRYVVDIREGKRIISDGKADLLLTSVSRNSDLEINYITLAKKQSIKTVTMLEHWVNYKGRFGYPSRQWRKNLPDEIWVMDEIANKTAEKEFGREIKIKMKPNFYFKDLKTEYSNIAASKDRKFFNVLFLSEPIVGHRNPKEKKVVIAETEKVVKLIEFMNTMDCNKPVRFTIRPHPIERSSEYSEILEYNSDSHDFRVALSDLNLNSLVEDIKNSDVVLGIKSSALIIASLFKNTISCCDKLPLWFLAYDVRHIRPNLKGLEHFLYGRRK